VSDKDFGMELLDAVMIKGVAAASCFSRVIDDCVEEKT